MRNALLALMLLLFTGLAGCAPLRSVPETAQDKLDSLVLNQTTRAEMIDLFGKPRLQAIASDSRMEVIWHYDTPQRPQDLHGIFDAQDVLERYVFTDPDPSLRYGK